MGKNKNLANTDVYKVFPTPRVGLEPTTPRLTAACSTIELSRTILFPSLPGPSSSHTPSKSHTEFSPKPYIPLTMTSCLLPFSSFHRLSGQALDRLVTVSSMHCCTSTSALSTSSSSRGLISSQSGISHLEGGFTLRCLQRLSRPGLATLPCTWRCNRSTSGRSIPVLSY